MDANVLLQFMNDPKEWYLSKKVDLTSMLVGKVAICDISLYRIDSIIFNDTSDHLMAQENVLDTMQIEGVLFLYLVHGKKEKTCYYYGIVPDLALNMDRRLRADVLNEANETFKATFAGNYPGSVVTQIEETECKTILEAMDQYTTAAILEGATGLYNEKNTTVLGADKFSKAMSGDEYMLLRIARPLSLNQITDSEAKVEKASDTILSNANRTVTNQMSNSNNNTRNLSTGKVSSKTNILTMTETRKEVKAADNPEVSGDANATVSGPTGQPLGLPGRGMGSTRSSNDGQENAGVAGATGARTSGDQASGNQNGGNQISMAHLNAQSLPNWAYPGDTAGGGNQDNSVYGTSYRMPSGAYNSGTQGMVGGVPGSGMAGGLGLGGRSGGFGPNSEMRMAYGPGAYGNGRNTVGNTNSIVDPSNLGGQHTSQDGIEPDILPIPSGTLAPNRPRNPLARYPIQVLPQYFEYLDEGFLINDRERSRTFAKSKNCLNSVSGNVSNSEMCGRSRATTVTRNLGSLNAKSWQDYLVTVLYKRLDYAKAKGLYLGTTYVLTNGKANLLKLENAIKPMYNAALQNRIPYQRTELAAQDHRKKIFKNLQIPRYVRGEGEGFSEDERTARSVFSQIAQRNYIEGGNWLSTKELSTMMALPSKIEE